MSEHKEISPLCFDFRGNPRLEASSSPPKKRSFRRGTLSFFAERGDGGGEGPARGGAGMIYLLSGED